MCCDLFFFLVCLHSFLQCLLHCKKTSASLNFSDPCNGETPSTSFTGTYFLKNQGRSDLQAALLVVISSAFCSLCFISISINHRREGEGSHTRKSSDISAKASGCYQAPWSRQPHCSPHRAISSQPGGPSGLHLFLHPTPTLWDKGTTANPAHQKGWKILQPAFKMSCHWAHRCSLALTQRGCSIPGLSHHSGSRRDRVALDAIC